MTTEIVGFLRSVRTRVAGREGSIFHTRDPILEVVEGKNDWAIEVGDGE